MKVPSFLFLLLMVGVLGCNKVFEKPRWNTDVKAPLIKTSLSINNIVRDTSMVKIGTDSSVRIVSRTELYSNSISIDSFAKIEVEPYTQNVKLSTLMLAPQEITRKVTLGQLALQMNNEDGRQIMAYNGKEIPFPGAYDLQFGPMDIDIKQFFEEAEIRTGTMDITLRNELPVDISNLQFEIRNKTGNQVVTSQAFTNLNSKTAQTKSTDLAGKYVEGVLALNVLDMDMPPKFFPPVKIDTSDAIFVTIKIYNVTVNSATAVFPAQDVVNETNQVPLEGMGDVMLTKARVFEGEVEAFASSTSEDTVFFTYTINSATLNGQPFVMKVAVPPKAVNKHFTAKFDGYNVNLRGQFNDTVNAFSNTIVGSLKYTGKKVRLSLADSFDVTVRIKKFSPSYIEGYFGSKTINLGAGSYPLDIFKNIRSGTLNFEQVNTRLVVENALGVEGGFKINSLTGVNTKTGLSQSISAPLGGVISPATNSPLVPSTSIKSLEANDSKNILNVLPDQINYDVVLSYNTPSNPPMYYDQDSRFKNFAYRDNYLKPYLEIEIPLSVLAKDLVLMDTTEFSSGQLTTSINNGSFTVLVDNGFPIGGDLDLYFLDQYGTVIDMVSSASGILPAQLNPTTKKVSNKTTSKIPFFVDSNRMKNILNARKLVFKVKFSTVDAASNNPVKIYSDYTIDFKLVGDFNYTVE